MKKRSQVANKGKERRFWDSIKRLFRYVYLKTVKEKGSPDYVARGWAIGVLANWLLPFGQMPLALALSFIFKGSKIGALLGTWVTNPVTTIFLYPFQCYLGSVILGKDLSIAYFRQALTGIMEDQSWEVILETARNASGTLISSFWVGGVVYTLVTVPFTYFLTRFLVVRYRRLREKRKAKKRMQVADNSNPDE